MVTPSLAPKGEKRCNNLILSHRYDLQLTLLDAEKEEHHLPCECHMTKCILMKTHLEKMQVEEEQH